jgi:hypothetical protein
MKRLNLTPGGNQCAQGCAVWVNLRQRTKASRRLGPLQVKGRFEYRYSHVEAYQFVPRYNPRGHCGARHQHYG